jgi:hypothetical protein
VKIFKGFIRMIKYWNERYRATECDSRQLYEQLKIKMERKNILKPIANYIVFGIGIWFLNQDADVKWIGVINVFIALLNYLEESYERKIYIILKENYRHK